MPPSDFFKPRFHITMEGCWINDPCGFSVFNGRYHLFHQYHPGIEPIGLGQWAHLVSDDLVRWTRLDPALWPELDVERDGIYTGSAVQQGKQHVLYYSAHQAGRVPPQVVCRARSFDGHAYHKDMHGPILEGITPDGHREMRDPCVFFREGKWRMLQGTTRQGKAEVVLYESLNGTNWQYRSVFFSTEQWTGEMYECPSFFSLADGDYLVVSPMCWQGHNNIYVRGKAEWSKGYFVIGQWADLDLGSDCYAAQTMTAPNGESFIISWMRTWGKPHPETQFGWGGVLGLVRSLTAGENGRLRQLPVPGVRALFATPSTFKNFRPTESWTHPDFCGRYKRLTLHLAADCKREAIFCLRFHAESSGEMKITMDMSRGQITIDKRPGILNDNTCRTVEYSFRESGELELEIYLDGCAFEMFLDGGLAVISEQIYPRDGSCRHEIITTREDVSVVCLTCQGHIYTENGRADRQTMMSQEKEPAFR